MLFHCERNNYKILPKYMKSDMQNDLTYNDVIENMDNYPFRGEEQPNGYMGKTRSIILCSLKQFVKTFRPREETCGR